MSLDAKETAEKRLSQRERILEALRDAGEAGCTSAELNAIGFRYGGRIYELRKLGYDIRTSEIPGSQLARFVLKPEVLATGQLELLGAR